MAVRSPCTTAVEEPLLFTIREKPAVSNEDPAQPKINKSILKKRESKKHGLKDMEVNTLRK